jgi:hypothetical protein
MNIRHDAVREASIRVESLISFHHPTRLSRTIHPLIIQQVIDDGFTYVSLLRLGASRWLLHGRFA